MSLVSPPLKRSSRESITLGDANVRASKCAEIFVTNNADKWTFFCVHCEKATSDIGAFICHIRLEHLNGHEGKEVSNKDVPSAINKSPAPAAGKETMQIGEDENIEDVDQQSVTRISTVSKQRNDSQPLPSKVQKIVDVTVLKQLPARKKAHTGELFKKSNTTSLVQPPASKEIEDPLANSAIDHTAADNVPKISNVTSLRQLLQVNIEAMNFLAPSAEEYVTDDQQPVKCNVVKKEIITNEEENMQGTASKVPKITDVTSLRQAATSKKREHVTNKNISSKTLQQQSSKETINQEFFAVSAIDQDLDHQDQEEIVEVVYLNEGENEISTNQTENNNETNMEDISHTEDAAMSSYTPSDEDHEEEDVNNANLKGQCTYCQEMFPNMQSLYAHISQQHKTKFRQQFPFECRKCDKAFKYKDILEKHTMNKHKRITLQCPVCPLKRTCLLAHVRTHESDTCFPCQVCGKIFDSNHDRMEHWETHAAEKPFPCEICFQRFVKPQYLTHHMKSHPRYQCSLCSILFNAKESQKPPYVCEICKEVPENMVVEVNPEVTTSAGLLESSDNTETITNIEINTNCSDSFKDDDTISITDNDDDSDIEVIDESYDDNMPSVSNSNIEQTPMDDDNRPLYKCLYCSREFISKTRLICHTSKMHDKGGNFLSHFICRFCNRSFQTRSGLAMHRRTHDKSNQLHCPVCPLTEFRESAFITHVLTHESDTCFPCQVCAKIFTSNSERMQHWQTHIKERPHGCNHCHRRFHHKNVLKNHMKSHGQYYCHFCQVNFKSECTILPPYVCTKCKKLSYVKKQLEGRSKSKMQRKGQLIRRGNTTL